MKLLDQLEKYFEAKGDQDGDKDQDFADIMIARMVASGMSKDDAIKKVKDKEYNESIEEGEIDEMSSTASVPGYQTPMAFQSKPKSGKDKEKEDDTVMQGGLKKVKKTNKYFRPMESKSTYKKMMSEMYGVVNEVSYRDYKKDPTSTPQQKVNRGIMEVNKMLGEMEKIVANNLRLKTEMGVQSNHFWKATGKRFSKINERMIRIANRLKELSQ
jgi:hypothetical protein